MAFNAASVLALLLFLPSLIRSLAINTPLLTEYDYIIVGGGASGLTVANRLTENANITVLVLEAGGVADDSAGNLIPVDVGGNIFSGLNWNLYTVPQTYMDGGARYYPLGKGLGGGTLINGMLWNRGGMGDYDAWVSLGNPGWAWSDMLPYFIKSENFTALLNTTKAQRFGATNNAAFHGTSGPVKVAYSKYIYPASQLLFEGLQYLGVPTLEDPNSGTGAGATYLPVDLLPRNQTRCSAATAYYDPIAGRSNLYVSTGQMVTQLIFEQTGCANSEASTTRASTPPAAVPAGVVQHGLFGLDITPIPSSPAKRQAIIAESDAQPRPRAPYIKRQSSADPTAGPLQRIAGVEYASGDGATRQTVYARREVILAAGATHTPQILELSGIGQSSFLSTLNITTIIDLPGVGNNLQDHLLVPTQYPYQNASFIYPSQLNNATTNNAAMVEYYASRHGPWTAGPPDGNAFPSLPQISSNSASIAAAAAEQAPSAYLAPGLDSTVVAGYAAQKQLLVEALDDSGRAVYELINNDEGSLVVANMRPLTRGTVHISSSNAFDQPLIDPRYGSNPVDLQVLVECLLFNRQIIASPPMLPLQSYSFLPGGDLNDTELTEYIQKYGGTEYHSSGTAAMLPLALGGVVSPELLVYGTSNLRIVDTSIYPLVPASHLQAVAYGVAEKAADIIKASSGYQSTPVALDINPAVPCSPKNAILNHGSLSAGPVASNSSAIHSAISTATTTVSVPTTLGTTKTVTAASSIVAARRGKRGTVFVS